MTYTLRLLGSPSLDLVGRRLTLERKTAAVLAYLAVEGETSKYKLSGWLWPYSGEKAARNNMRQLLRRLRLSGGNVVEGNERIALSSAVSTDVSYMSSLDLAKVLQLKTRANLLEGLDYDDAPDYAEWLDNIRDEFAALHLRAAETEAERLEASGQLGQALELAQLAVKLEPLSEKAHCRVMRLYYLTGSRAAALAAFERCKEILAEELGAEPLPETLELAELVERGAVLKDAPPRQDTHLPTAILRPPVLAGREREWAQIEEAWASGKFIFVVSEPGMGKSRLATDFLTSKGSFVPLETRPGDAKVPYSTNARFVRIMLARYQDYTPPEWVRQTLAPWMPELGPAPVTPDLGLQSRYYEAVGHVFDQIGLHGEAAFVDDLQFMDDVSAETGEFLLSQLFPLRQPGGLTGFVSCYRKGELSPLIEQMHAEMVARGMAVRIFLEPLPGEAIGTLLGGLGLPETEHLVPGLSRYTGGNPLFVLETLKHLIETDTLTLGLPPRLAPPGRVAALVTRRLQRLSPQALGLARSAAVSGTSFDMRLAAFVLERPMMELAEAHAELEASQVLSANAFTHDLVFEAVLASIPLAMKQVLHARTASYLEALGNVNPGIIAQHYVESGDLLEAAPFLLQSSRRSYQGSALSEALRLVDQAVDIYQAHGDPREFDAVKQRFEILGMSGTLADIEQTSARLIQLARDDREKAGALASWAESLSMAWRFEAALEKAEEALALVGALDALSHASLRQTELHCALRLGRFERAEQTLDVYKALAAELDDLEVKGSVIEDEGVYHAALGRHEKAVQLFEQALSRVDQTGAFSFERARLLSRRAHSELVLGLTDAALENARRAKNLVDEYAITTRGKVWPCTAEALTYLALGRLREAWNAAREAERYNQTKGPKISYLALARVLHALGQQEHAEAELESLFAQQATDPIQTAAALLLFSRLTGCSEALQRAEALLADIPKPELHLQLFLTKTAFVPPAEALHLAGRALATAAPLKLKLLEAEALVRKAQALSKLGRLEEGQGAIEKAIAHQASFVSPAEIFFTAHEIDMALGGKKAEAHLESARAWLGKAAGTLDGGERETFLNQPLHRRIL